MEGSICNIIKLNTLSMNVVDSSVLFTLSAYHVDTGLSLQTENSTTPRKYVFCVYVLCLLLM